LYSRLSELPLDAATLWLSGDELAVWTGMRSTTRQATWVAGRIVAKRLLLELLGGQHRLANLHPTKIHIESRSTRTGHGERPVVTVSGRRVPLSLSIAHTERGAIAAATLSAAVTLGIDLVSPSDAGRTLHWTFTDAERSWLTAPGDHTNRAARLWSMKEAIYKACQRGEGFAPRDIEVTPGQPPRYPHFDANDDLVLLQSWRVDGHAAALAIVNHSDAARLTNDHGHALLRAA